MCQARIDLTGAIGVGSFQIMEARSLASSPVRDFSGPTGVLWNLVPVSSQPSLRIVNLEGISTDHPVCLSVFE